VDEPVVKGSDPTVAEFTSATPSCSNIRQSIARFSGSRLAPEIIPEFREE
jgi:hypothetical protein